MDSAFLMPNIYAIDHMVKEAIQMRAIPPCLGTEGLDDDRTADNDSLRRRRHALA